MGRLETSIIRLEATLARAALPLLIRFGFDGDLAKPAIFCRAVRLCL